MSLLKIVPAKQPQSMPFGRGWRTVWRRRALLPVLGKSRGQFWHMEIRCARMERRQWKNNELSSLGSLRKIRRISAPASSGQFSDNGDECSCSIDQTTYCERDAMLQDIIAA